MAKSCRRVTDYQYSFSAIWMMRGWRAPVMRPKLPEVTVVFGLFSSVWLKALKNSARYCSFNRSVKRKYFSAEKSMLNVPGPRQDVAPGVAEGAPAVAARTPRW